MKKNLFLLLILMMLVFTMMLTGCSGTSDSENDTGNKTTQSKNDNNAAAASDTEKTENNNGTADEVSDNDTLAASSSENTEVPATAATILSNKASLNNVDYIVLKTRLVDSSEYEADDDQKAILVSMTVSNESSEFISISPYMNFSFYDENGDDQSGVEPYEGVSEHNLSGVVGPGKVLTGEFLVLVDSDTTLVTLEILENFMSDESAKLSFEADQAYEDATYISNNVGKGFGEVIEDADLSYVINSATKSQDDEDTLITVNITATNNTSADFDLYEIPFRLIDENGYECELSYMMDSFTFAGVPAGSTKDAEVIFVAKTPEASNYDLYYAPFVAAANSDLYDMVFLGGIE